MQSCDDSQDHGTVPPKGNPVGIEFLIITRPPIPPLLSQGAYSHDIPRPRRHFKLQAPNFVDHQFQSQYFSVYGYFQFNFPTKTPPLFDPFGRQICDISPSVLYLRVFSKRLHIPTCSVEFCDNWAELENTTGSMVGFPCRVSKLKLMVVRQFCLAVIPPNNPWFLTDTLITI